MARKKKVDNITEDISYNDFGEEIHVFNGPQGEVRVKEINPSAFLPTGEQWCPDCHIQLVHKIGEGYWECPNCRYSITDDEVAYGDGAPTLEASYETDYGDGIRYEDIY